MIFFYVYGALLCDIRIPGLTKRIGGWTVDNWWLDELPSDDEEYGYYHKYFIAESMTREQAETIVKALGGYLAKDFKTPPQRQLTAGGPFYVHQFHLFQANYMDMAVRAEKALEFAADKAQNLPPNSGWSIRVYDSHKNLVAEFPGNH